MESTYFQWDKDFLTGMEEVDEQHYGLVEIINDLLKLSLKSEKAGVDQIDEILDRLSAYVIEHFKTENDLMRRHGVDLRHIEMHTKLHNEFIATINQFFLNKEAIRKPEKLSEISEFLVRWLAYHILNMDKSMARQIEDIKNKGLSSPEAYDKDCQFIDVTAEPLLKALKALFYLVSLKNKELEAHNHDLELKVKQRTFELEEVNKQLFKLSMTDELTGLSNRRCIMNEIERLINQFERYQTAFSLLFIDLDNFKSVNDTYGHERGDEVLIWFSRFLQKHVRKTDIVSRVGGDEFIVICTNSIKKGALTLAENLNNLVKVEFNKVHDSFWNPSISIGIVEMNSSINTASDLLILADSKMYRDKKMKLL